MIFLCLRVLGEAPGIDLGCPGEPPGKDFARILGHSLCVTLVVRGLLFLFQVCAKFVQIPDQLLFYRLCLTPVALPSVAGAVVSRSVLN